MLTRMTLVALPTAVSGPAAYADAVATYLGFAIAIATIKRSRPWLYGEPKMRRPAGAFGGKQFRCCGTYAEANPFGGAGGDIEVGMQSLSCKSLIARHCSPGTITSQRMLEDSNFRSGLVYSTDPPYYDNIGYADFSDFFYVWHRGTL